MVYARKEVNVLCDPFSKTASRCDGWTLTRFEPFALPRWHESGARRQVAVGFGRLLPLHKTLPLGDKARIQNSGLIGKSATPLAPAAKLGFRRKTESFSLDLLIDAAAAGIFRIPAEQEIDDDLA